MCWHKWCKHVTSSAEFLTLYSSMPLRQPSMSFTRFFHLGSPEMKHRIGKHKKIIYVVMWPEFEQSREITMCKSKRFLFSFFISAIISSSGVFSLGCFLDLIWPVVKFMNSGIVDANPPSCLAKRALEPESRTRPDMLAWVFFSALNPQNLECHKCELVQSRYRRLSFVATLVVFHHLL